MEGFYIAVWATMHYCLEVCGGVDVEVLVITIVMCYGDSACCR